MKKLMIAAAAAVVAGSMFAAPYVYDFDATVKTTQGRAGVVTVNLGMNAAGTDFWYNDPEIQAAWKDATKVINGIAVPTIKAETVNANPDIQKAILKIAGTYSYKSAGRWCETYRISGCYRVAGTKRYTDQFTQADCCAAGGYKLESLAGSTIVWQERANNISEPLFQRFGSADPIAANKVEIYAPVTLKTAGVADPIFGGWLAGQGTMARRNAVWYISTISGNIVGTLPAPKCENCCTLPTPSVAFDCKEITSAALPFTAGFGTFRLRINNNLTTF